MGELFGRVALFDDDIDVFYRIAKQGKTYVEIGTLFGGSACLAGLAGCEVFCIDPLDGYYSDKCGEHNRIDTVTGMVATPAIVRANWALCGLDMRKLHLYPQLHPPWPRGLNRPFDIGFIDGDHRYIGAMLDWLGMSPRITKYLMIHDKDKAGVKPVVEAACKHPAWESRTAAANTHIAILKRLP